MMCETKDNHKVLYKISDARKMLSISEYLINKLISDGKINIVMVGQARRISKDEIDRIKNEGTEKNEQG